ncbi:MAG: [protein-PII] uridylyltransferase [Proteobacteria bacterium]|nr:[protein-PII] uridylyltransferase [Pseudomonadota bacterium]
MTAVAAKITAAAGDAVPRRGQRSEVADPRRIVNRRQLGRDLAALAGEGERSPAELKKAVLERLKQALGEGRAELQRRFLEAHEPGPEVARAAAFFFDQLIRVVFDFADQELFPTPNPTDGERIAIVAVGGYGRGELAPFSDIDLLFLLPYKQTPRSEQVIESMLYTLWDLGLKVGHATRSIEECLRQARADMTIRTALLESRYIWGDQPLYLELKRRFQKEIVASTAPAFVEAKLAEAERRHQRFGDSRYVVEPNIKEGKGGLRDLHTLFWIAKYVYRVDSVGALVDHGVLTESEARTFAKAENLLWTLRTHLHILVGRAEERLTFDVQAELSQRMGYRDHAGTRGVERFMKHYYLVAKDVGDLTRILATAIESANRKRPRFRLARLAFKRRAIDGFPLDGERLSVASDDAFEKNPVDLIRLFHVAQANGLELHPKALQLVTRNLALIDAKLRANREANRLFLEILAATGNSERILRRMNESGVFGRFVPDFGRVVAQMQYDMYHVYTTDEHTLFALGILHRIELGELQEAHPVSSTVIHKVQSRRALYVALLLHDIAKGRGGDHSHLGAGIARSLGPRLGLSAEETETAAWLVQYHLLMSNTAFKRDINDAKTIEDFAAAVQSPERLRLLLVLTVADIRAVGPNVWNNWKAALLRELYWRTEELLTGAISEAARAQRVQAAQDKLRALVADWPEEDFQAHLARGYPGYWLSLDPETHARHGRLVREAERDGAPLAIDTRVDPSRAITEITIYTADHPGLFARIAGAIAVAGANIVDAKIFTLATGMALDSFGIQDLAGEAFARPDRLARLAVLIEQSLAGRLKLDQELAKRGLTLYRTRGLALPPRVFIDNKASAAHTLVEVNGRDRPGLLYELTRALTGLSLQISSAKIATYGERVVDVFYVKDIFGLKIEHEGRLAQIRERLIQVLEVPPAKATPAPKEPAAAQPQKRKPKAALARLQAS